MDVGGDCWLCIDGDGRSIALSAVCRRLEIICCVLKLLPNIWRERENSNDYLGLWRSSD